MDGRDGDLFAAGYTIELRGPIGDSTRIAGLMLTVDTTIDGDLLAAGTELLLTENALVAGGLVAAGSLVEIDGTVGDGARVAAGEIVVRGTVNGDATPSPTASNWRPARGSPASSTTGRGCP